MSSATGGHRRPAGPAGGWWWLLIGLTASAAAAALAWAVASPPQETAAALGSALLGSLATLGLREWQGWRQASALQQQRDAADQRRQDLLQQIERFVSRVTHDLKSPLAEVEMALQLLRQEAGSDDGLAQRIASVRATCRDMRALLDDLLEHHRARWSDLRLATVHAGDLVAEVLERYESEIAERRARVHVREPLPEVQADRQRLSSALGNLLQNALRHGALEQAPQVTISGESHGQMVRLLVEDAGPGLTPDQVSHVFDAFYRGQPDQPGTGLGLAIVRRVAESHGGRAWVECPPGGGARFIMELPGPAACPASASEQLTSSPGLERQLSTGEIKRPGLSL